MRTTQKNLSNSKNITPAEFNKLYKDNLAGYVNGIWSLADLLALGQQKFGRKTLVELTSLPLTKIKWLVAIASVPRNPHLLPEHHVEVIYETDQRKWLKIAETENLDPIELRKRIRASRRKSVDKSKATGVNTYPRYVDSISREISRLNADDKTKAVEYIKRNLAL